jgi:hypothetical protein
MDIWLWLHYSSFQPSRHNTFTRRFLSLPLSEKMQFCTLPHVYTRFYCDSRNFKTTWQPSCSYNKLQTFPVQTQFVSVKYFASWNYMTRKHANSCWLPENAWIEELRTLHTIFDNTAIPFKVGHDHLRVGVTQNFIKYDVMCSCAQTHLGVVNSPYSQ